MKETLSWNHTSGLPVWLAQHWNSCFTEIYPLSHPLSEGFIWIAYRIFGIITEQHCFSTLFSALHGLQILQMNIIAIHRIAKARQPWNVHHTELYGLLQSAVNASTDYTAVPQGSWCQSHLFALVNHRSNRQRPKPSGYTREYSAGNGASIVKTRVHEELI